MLPLDPLTPPAVMPLEPLVAPPELLVPLPLPPLVESLPPPEPPPEPLSPLPLPDESPRPDAPVRASCPPSSWPPALPPLIAFASPRRRSTEGKTATPANAVEPDAPLCAAILAGGLVAAATARGAPR